MATRKKNGPAITPKNPRNTKVNELVKPEPIPLPKSITPSETEYLIDLAKRTGKTIVIRGPHNAAEKRPTPRYAVLEVPTEGMFRRFEQVYEAGARLVDAELCGYHPLSLSTTPKGV